MPRIDGSKPSSSSFFCRKKNCKYTKVSRQEESDDKPQEGRAGAVEEEEEEPAGESGKVTRKVFDST